MDAISHLTGDEEITDFPKCPARPLAAIVQCCNHLLAGPDGYLSPEDSILALDLGWRNGLDQTHTGAETQELDDHGDGRVHRLLLPGARPGSAQASNPRLFVENQLGQRDIRPLRRPERDTSSGSERSSEDTPGPVFTLAC